MAVVDTIADRLGTRKVAEEYLKYLYSPEGQKIAAKNFYRPSDRKAVDAELLKPFAELKLFTVDEVFGGWQTRRRPTSPTAEFSTRFMRKMMAFQLKKPSVLPGFGLTMGFTLFYLSLLVLIPLAGLVLQTTTMGWSRFVKTVTQPEILASYRLSVGASLAGALVNVVFGFLVAWVLVRYTFPGKKLIDAIVDLPFALPTAVSGIALSALYARDGWIGRLFPRAWRFPTRIGAW